MTTLSWSWNVPILGEPEGRVCYLSASRFKTAFGLTNWVRGTHLRALNSIALAMTLLISEPLLVLSGVSAAPSTIKADRVVVLKSERQMILMQGDAVLRIYRVALGRYPKGPKVKKGDAKTPEGNYTIDYRFDSDRSKFYRSLHISYPNSRDRARALERGVHPGGQIMIHGLPTNWSANDVGHPYLDWTQGCIALTNPEMDEIWEMVSNGTRIEIYP